MNIGRAGTIFLSPVKFVLSHLVYFDIHTFVYLLALSLHYTTIIIAKTCTIIRLLETMMFIFLENGVHLQLR